MDKTRDDGEGVDRRSAPHPFWQLLVTRLTVLFLERLVRDFALDKQLGELTALSLALEWHDSMPGRFDPAAEHRSGAGDVGACGSDSAESSRFQGSRSMDRTITSFKGEYLWELQIPASQIMALAEAIPADKYSWRPADQARSVSEVFVHIAVGNLLLLDQAGVSAPKDLYGLLESDILPRMLAIIRKNLALEKGVTDKAEVVPLLKRALEATQKSFTEATDEGLVGQATFFGQETTVRRVYLRMLAHMNEHMGQMVAYARSMGIPAPWQDPLALVGLR
jgi:uncharacterized damage-inducible protein DinB